MLSSGLINSIEQTLFTSLKHTVNVNGFAETSGGSINNCFTLDTNSGKYFLKYNSASLYPNLFQLEAEGLQAMYNTYTITIPEVVGCGVFNDKAYLLLQHIQQGSVSTKFWELFAESLAAMHRVTNNSYGWQNSNYIGTLVQVNTWHNNWIEFFIEQRLQNQITLANSSGLLTVADLNAFDKLFKKLNDILLVEPPAMLHGDLWSGNYMVDSNGKPVIFDPAIYYGNREVDLAMSTLFGGFDGAFYDAYKLVFPLEQGYETRFDIYNLYPLLIHLNLFGAGYLTSIRTILKRFQ